MYSMNIILWIAQIILMLLFLQAGFKKVFRYPEFIEQAPGMANLEKGTVKFIGTSETLGAIGVVLPLWLNILPILTPIAALGLATIMILAISFHLKRHEPKALPMPLVLLILALWVAWGRWPLVS